MRLRGHNQVRAAKEWSFLCAIFLSSTSAAGALLGVHTNAGCKGVDETKKFGEWLGVPAAISVDGFAMESWDALRKESSWAIRCWAAGNIRMSFSIPMLPTDKASGNPTDTLAEGASGKFDGVFRDIASELVKYGYADTIVRIGWEFNGHWFPWAAHKDPGNWVAYWRRIVTVMRSVPGAKFKFDWCINLRSASVDFKEIYPGDGYVDIIGADVYNESWTTPQPTGETRWQALLNQPAGLREHRDFARAHGKPMSFPEWGTGMRSDGRGGGDDPYFIAQMAEWIAANNVAYHAYWDAATSYNTRLSDGHLPLAASAYKEAFGNAAAQSASTTTQAAGPSIPKPRSHSNAQRRKEAR